MVLTIFSPICWIYTLREVPPQMISNMFYEAPYPYLNSLIFYSVGLVVCFILYYLLTYLFIRFDKKSKHPLLFSIAFYILISYASHLVKGHENQAPYIAALTTLIFVFFSNALVIIIYELHNVRRDNRIGIFQSFLLLNTMHSTFINKGGTQLSPKGTRHLLESRVPDSDLKKMQLKGLQVLLLCVGLKIGADIFGHLFFNFKNSYLSQLGLPQYTLVDLKTYKTIPIAFSTSDQSDASVYLAIVIRAFHWFALRFSAWNSKIALLWFLGIHIELGILNPFKSASFVDFFRNVHVYIADFYKVFIFPYVSHFFRFIKNPVTKKYFCLWFMIFLGGGIFQTISHSYQFYFWPNHSFFIALGARGFYDAALATIICISIFLEKKKINPKNKFPITRTLIYIICYTVIVSISSSIKNKDFSLYQIWEYLKVLIGV